MIKKLFLCMGVLLACDAMVWCAADRAAPALPLVHDIVFSGNQAVSSEQLARRITLKSGAPLRRDQFRYSLGLVQSLYRDKGYYEVEVDTATRPYREGQVDVRFEITEGPVFHIGQVGVTGNRVVSKEIILRNLDVHTGELFSAAKIFDSDRQLYMTGYFDTIDFSYSTTTAHTVDISIRVKERATRYIKGGLGYGTQTKERVTLGYEDMNFLGNARKLDVSGTWSGFLTDPSHYETKILQTNLTQPNLFGTKLEGQSNVSREWDRREPYDSITTAWKTSVGRRFGSKITSSFRYRYAGTRLTRISPGVDSPGFSNISAVGPTFTYDDTNDPFLPSIGWRVIGTYEEGVRFFAGDVRFHKLETRIGRFDTVIGGWTLFEGLQGGEILPDSTSDRDIIPIYERYFIGGANTVRGYSERELGPRDAQGVPIGGNAFLVGNYEMRHQLYKKLYGVLFLDGGQLYATLPGHKWPDARMTRLEDFRYATGCGLRINSPVGAIRLEFGYKLNPQTGTGFLDRTALHFSIGETF